MIKKTIELGKYEKKYTIQAMIVKVYSKYEINIYIDKDNKTVNVKSIMGMMSLILRTGDSIVLRCEGTDEDRAMESLVSCLQ